MKCEQLRVHITQLTSLAPIKTESYGHRRKLFGQPATRVFTASHTRQDQFDATARKEPQQINGVR